jgi:hypothetical protein
VRSRMSRPCAALCCLPPRPDHALSELDSTRYH